MVPSSPAKKIEPTGDFTNVASVEVAGCVFALPSDQFSHDADPKRENVVLNHARYRMLILPCSDAKTWDSIMQSVGQTNFYEFVRSVFNATERQISKQGSVDALTRHLILLKAKSMLTPLGFENSCIEFDRGDLKGFIVGDPAQNKNLYVRAYVPGREQLIDLCIIQKAHLQMSEVENLISLLKVKTNHSIQRTGASRSAHASLVAQRPLAPSADAVRYAVTQSGVRC
jgi:hypothetical protein